MQLRGCQTVQARGVHRGRIPNSTVTVDRLRGNWYVRGNRGHSGGGDTAFLAGGGGDTALLAGGGGTIGDTAGQSGTQQFLPNRNDWRQRIPQYPIAVCQ